MSSEKALELKAAQVTALLAWLHGGGQLVVGVEHANHVIGNDWLRRLLPCDISSLTTLSDHAELQEWVTGKRRGRGGRAGACRHVAASPEQETSRQSTAGHGSLRWSGFGSRSLNGQPCKWRPVRSAMEKC